MKSEKGAGILGAISGGLMMGAKTALVAGMTAKETPPPQISDALVAPEMKIPAAPAPTLFPKGHISLID
jgi:hypothetical protein